MHVEEETDMASITRRWTGNGQESLLGAAAVATPEEIARMGGEATHGSGRSGDLSSPANNYFDDDDDRSFRLSNRLGHTIDEDDDRLMSHEAGRRGAGVRWGSIFDDDDDDDDERTYRSRRGAERGRRRGYEDDED
jgi:hypothetical protein